MRVIKFKQPIFDFEGNFKWWHKAGFNIHGTGFTDPQLNAPICQYTGLKDIAGNEIYEGDILHYKAKLYKIMYADAMFSGYTKDSEELPLWQIAAKGEVVGNMHENKELMQA